MFLVIYFRELNRNLLLEIGIELRHTIVSLIQINNEIIHRQNTNK